MHAMLSHVASENYLISSHTTQKDLIQVFQRRFDKTDHQLGFQHHYHKH